MSESMKVLLAAKEEDQKGAERNTQEGEESVESAETTLGKKDNREGPGDMEDLAEGSCKEVMISSMKEA